METGPRVYKGKRVVVGKRWRRRICPATDAKYVPMVKRVSNGDGVLIRSWNYDIDYNIDYSINYKINKYIDRKR